MNADSPRRNDEQAEGKRAEPRHAKIDVAQIHPRLDPHR